MQLGAPAFDKCAELLKRARALLAGPQAVRPELQRLADDLRACGERRQALELEARIRALTETAAGAAQQR